MNDSMPSSYDRFFNLDDVIQQVFVSCLPDEVTPDNATAPLVLLRVCRRWREQALSYPFLWSSIVMKFDRKRSVVQIVNGMRILHTWLLRSRSAPFDLRVIHEKRVGQGAVEDDVEDLHSFFELLVPHLGRLRTLDVDRNCALLSAMRSIVSETPADAAPQLQKLRLVNRKRGQRWTNTYTIPTQHSQTVYLRKIHFSERTTKAGEPKIFE